MGLRINTNVTALKSQRNLNESTMGQADALEKLSSGSRINRAGDDAAGLAISEKLKASIRGLSQAKRNANDGISLVQTAEGGLNEVSNILIRLRELSVQAASDTIGPEERQYTNLEFQALVGEVERISQVTNFNGTSLLNGKAADPLEFQVGINNSPTNDRLSYDTSKQNATVESLGLKDLMISSKIGAQENLSKIDVAISNISGQRAELGALQNRLGSTIRNLGIQTENLSEANSRIRDADFASVSSELTKQSILNQAGVSVMSQANSSQMNALKLIGN
jgi:flagellin